MTEDADGGLDVPAGVVRAVELFRRRQPLDADERDHIADACARLLDGGPAAGGVEVRLNDGEFGWVFYSQTVRSGTCWYGTR